MAHDTERVITVANIPHL